MNKNKKQGLSLIVLVITIIVMIILAAAVVAKLKTDNPVKNAQKVVFQNDLSGIIENMQIYFNKQLFKDDSFDKNSCTKDPVDEDMIGEEYKNYIGKVKIKDGKLCLKSGKVTEEEKKWAKEIGIETN